MALHHSREQISTVPQHCIGALYPSSGRMALGMVILDLAALERHILLALISNNNTSCVCKIGCTCDRSTQRVCSPFSNHLSDQKGFNGYEQRNGSRTYFP